MAAVVRSERLARKALDKSRASTCWSAYFEDLVAHVKHVARLREWREGNVVGVVVANVHSGCVDT